MADVRHVVDAVQVGLPGVVVEVHAQPAHDLERLPVGDAQVVADAPAPLGQRLGLARRGRGEGRLRNAQQHVRVGREAQVDRPLARRRHAGEVGVQLQQVRDDLQVQVRRPVAVGRRRPDCPHLFAGGDALPHLHAIQRANRQVAVERVKRRAVARRVAQHDHRAVVLARRVVGERMHYAAEGRIDRRIRRRKNVDPQVDRAPFADGAARDGEVLAHIDRSRLVVAANQNRRNRGVSARPARRLTRTSCRGMKSGEDAGAAAARAVRPDFVSVPPSTMKFAPSNRSAALQQRAANREVQHFYRVAL